VTAVDPALDRRDPELVERLVRLAGPGLERWFAPVIEGLERVPEGPALYVGNHNGGLFPAESFLLGLALAEHRGVDAIPHGLAHDTAIRAPLIGPLLRSLGAVPASHENALRLFAAERPVLVYPGGDLDAMRPFRERDRVVFGGRRGYMRLAIRAGVPIVPVVAAGAHASLVVLSDGRALARALRLDRLARLDVFPVSLALPWGVMVGTWPYLPLPTPVHLEFLPPYRTARSGDEAAGDEAYVAEEDARLRELMQAALTRLSAERRSVLGPLRARLEARWPAA
jgi:1-acyl-sn-glycerol-3-phosphate acyltransferase